LYQYEIAGITELDCDGSSLMKIIFLFLLTCGKAELTLNY